jgi:restriction system protein
VTTERPSGDPPFQGMVGSGDDLRALIGYWRRRKGYQGPFQYAHAAATQLIRNAGVPIESAASTPPVPSLVLPVAISLVERGDKVVEGQLITGVTIAWWAIIKELERNPEFLLHTIGGREVEELIAGAYERDGWKVILTPRSGDRGRDIIATRSDIAGSLRIIDQAKAYAPHRPVPASDVRELLAVLLTDQNATKAFITTTARFATGVYTDPGLTPHIPNRLELRDGPAVREWLLKNTPTP